MNISETYISHQRRGVVGGLHHAPYQSAALRHEVRGPPARGLQYGLLGLDHPRYLELT